MVSFKEQLLEENITPSLKIVCVCNRIMSHGPLKVDIKSNLTVKKQVVF